MRCPIFGDGRFHVCRLVLEKLGRSVVVLLKIIYFEMILDKVKAEW